MKGITPSQTIGPFAAPCMTPNEQGKTNYPWSQLINGDLVTPDAVGERIRIEGPLARHGGGDEPRAMREVADLGGLQLLLVLPEEEHPGDGHEHQHDVEGQEADRQSRETTQLHRGPN